LTAGFTGGLTGVDKQQYDLMVKCNVDFCNQLRGIKTPLTGDADETRNTTPSVFFCDAIAAVGDPRLWVGNWSVGEWSFVITGEGPSIAAKASKDDGSEEETWSDCLVQGNAEPATVLCQWRRTFCDIPEYHWNPGANNAAIVVASETSCDDEYIDPASEVIDLSIVQPKNGKVMRRGKLGVSYISNKGYVGADPFSVSLTLKNRNPAIINYTVTVKPQHSGQLEGVFATNKIAVTEWEGGQHPADYTLVRE
jgi:hypothetical protein